MQVESVLADVPDSTWLEWDDKSGDRLLRAAAFCSAFTTRYHGDAEKLYWRALDTCFAEPLYKGDTFIPGRTYGIGEEEGRLNVVALECMLGLARLYHAQGKTREAERLCHHAIKGRKKVNNSC